MRLIDADALLEKLKQNLRNYRDVMNDDGARATLIAIKDVENAPTIDAEPVVHAHWNANKANVKAMQEFHKKRNCFGNE